jgi:hypothetical protein
MTGLTIDEPYGTSEHHYNRRDFHPNPLNAVVVRKWHNRDYGLAGHMVFPTNAAVHTLLQPCEADDDRRLIEHGSIKASRPQWRVTQPPQTTARAVRVHVLFPRLMCALATA